MTCKPSILIRCLALLPAFALAACSGKPQVDAIRDATTRFRQVDVAEAEGYGQFLGCMSVPGEGAMGIHYINSSLLEDAAIDMLLPEALMYEPQADGSLQLVGLEYLVFVTAWDAEHSTPPEMFGEKFAITDDPALGVPPYYALHVWAWRDNPDSLTAAWNPQVSCPSSVARHSNSIKR